MQAHAGQGEGEDAQQLGADVDDVGIIDEEAHDVGREGELDDGHRGEGVHGRRGARASRRPRRGRGRWAPRYWPTSAVAAVPSAKPGEDGDLERTQREGVGGELVGAEVGDDAGVDEEGEHELRLLEADGEADAGETGEGGAGDAVQVAHVHAHGGGAAGSEGEREDAARSSPAVA